MNRITILPPERNQLPERTSETAQYVSGIAPGGYFSSAMTRREAARHERVFRAVTARVQSEVQLLNAHTAAIDAYGKRERAAAALAELPEIIADERDRRRAERAEELRELRHRHDLAQNRRAAERAQAEALLVEAEQALRAQQEYGYAIHELAWKQKRAAMLDLDVDAAERRHLLLEHEQTRHAVPVALEPRDDVDAALFEARSQLRASGLDTTKLDALIAARRGD